MREKSSPGNRWTRVLSIVVSFFVVGLPVFALDPEKRLSQYVISSWTERTGLSQASVMGVAQTNDGFVWLATEEGLVRFDGVRFTTFDERNSPGLVDRFVRSLAPAPDGSLWVGTRVGLVHYQNGVFRGFQRETDFRKDIYDLCVGRDGSVWFSSARGLHRFRDGKHWIYTTTDGLPADEITAIAESGDGSVWAGTRAGLVEFAHERFRTYTTLDGLSSNSINTISFGRDGALWIGTLDGKINRLHHGGISLKADLSHIRGARVQCIREDHDGNLWVAFNQAGLGRIRGKTLEIFTKRDGLPSNDPDWIYEDREHILWIGWSDAGLTSIRDGVFTNYGVPEGLSSDHITSVQEGKDGSIWVGTKDAGLNRIRNGKTTVFSEKDGLGGKAVLGMAETRDGSLWAGSVDGVATRLRDGHLTTFADHMHPPPRLSAMLEDRAGELWFGFETPGGLARMRNGAFEHLPFEGRPRGLAQSPDGALWIADSEEGLVRMQGGRSRSYREKDGLSSLLVISVYADPQGTVWAGTALAGLNRIKGGRISRISIDDGLFDSTVGAIVEDDYGFLWMTSSRGIFRVLKQQLNDFADGKIKAVQSLVFSVSDGLRSRESSIEAQPSAWKGRDGRLWFATMGGVASIDPRRVKVAKKLWNVAVDSISFNQKPAERPVNGMQLGPGNRRLEITLVVPAFGVSERSSVRYRLAGFDHEWTTFGGRRVASYTNLPPGNYRFEAQANNGDGLWGGDVVFDFVLLPLFYQTWWFRMLSAGALCLVAWKVYTFRVKYLVQKTAQLEEKISRRTGELQLAVAAAHKAQESLRELAIRDSLTGLLNRRATFEFFEKELARCHRSPSSLCVLMADLDHFKSINDTRGHLAGDQVLLEVAQRMQRLVGGAGIVGRYGGEEIMIVLPDCELETGRRRAEQIRAEIAARPFVTGTGPLEVTCSIGVAESPPGGTVARLMEDADAALYRAKAEGRNRVCAAPYPAFELTGWIVNA